METLSEQWLTEYARSHPRFQEKNLLKSRLMLSEKILSSRLPEDRQTWFLHQLNHAHTPEQVTDLITQVLC